MKVQVPICVCRHPLDAHDAKHNNCIMWGCECPLFTDSGRTEEVEING